MCSWLAKGIEEEGEENVVEEPVSLAPVAREEVQQVRFAAVSGRSAEPAFLLEEPEEEQAAELPRAEGEEGQVFLRVLAGQGRMARISLHECEYELVAEVPELLRELLRNSFNGERFSSSLGKGREILHAGGVQASQEFQVEATRRLQVDDSARRPGDGPLPL